MAVLAELFPLLLLLLLQVVPYLVDLLQDSCMAVRRVAGACLDAIMDSNEAAAGDNPGMRVVAAESAAVCGQGWLPACVLFV
jgi:hypothetical protein